MTTRKSTTCAMLRTQIAHTRFFTDMVGKTTRLEEGISVTGGETLGPAHTVLRQEEGISVTRGVPPDRHTQPPVWKTVSQ